MFKHMKNYYSESRPASLCNTFIAVLFLQE